jgi:4-hydroxy-3-methylbut-2-enyl diphosphate reductase
MKIITAKRAGFCFGVKRAIDMAFDVARKKHGGVCTLGPIIHNPQVVQKLNEVGVRPVNNFGELRRKGCKTVIIRTHGITMQEMKKLTDSRYEVIDATCPFVKKAQYYAKLLKKEGYKVVILGDKNHPEVKGLMSYAGKGVKVLENADGISSLNDRIGIVVQTTQRVENLKMLLVALVDRSKELKIYNTICNSTALKLKETEEAARTVDVVVVVGGKNSANTSQLANKSRGLGKPTYHIETGDELEKGWFRDTRKVLLTAGASTPDWIIQDVKKSLRLLGGKA